VRRDQRHGARLLGCAKGNKMSLDRIFGMKANFSMYKSLSRRGRKLSRCVAMNADRR
jgi:hypothetical protein